MARGLRKLMRVDASFHIPQEHLAIPRTCFYTSFKPFKDNAGANEEPLLFGQSYWDYLPDLVQHKIVKLVHKQFLKAVHDELLDRNSCPNCQNHFENAFEMERHWSAVCKGKYWWDSDSNYDSNSDWEGDDGWDF